MIDHENKILHLVCSMISYFIFGAAEKKNAKANSRRSLHQIHQFQAGKKKEKKDASRVEFSHNDGKVKIRKVDNG